jgi:Tfp pilus assembly protein PilE
MCNSRQPLPQPRSTRAARGFTLLEVIVIVVVAGLLAGLVAQYMGTQLTRASSPAAMARNTAGAEAEMEALVADFTTRVNNDNATALNTFKAAHPNNATLTIVDDPNWNGVRALTVTVTIGGASYTTLLTQARTNSNDSPASY